MGNDVLSLVEGVKKQLADIGDTICREYCKFPDEYSSLYCDDMEEADERLAIEKCENCPFGGLGVW